MTISNPMAYLLRPDDERAAFEWWLQRRSAEWSVTLHTVRCAVDDRDYALVLALREARLLCDRQGALHCILAGYETALEGWDDETQSLVELGLAMRIPQLPRRYRIRPRLEPCEWTEDDRRMWDRGALKVGFHPIRSEGRYFDWLGHYQNCDRRDADLMLIQRKLRASLKPVSNYIRWMDLHPFGGDITRFV